MRFNELLLLLLSIGLVNVVLLRLLYVNALHIINIMFYIENNESNMTLLKSDENCNDHFQKKTVHGHVKCEIS